MEKNLKCPKCKGKSQSVGVVTVEHMVKDEFRNKVKYKNYSICLEQDCDVVYFSQNEDIIIKRNDLKIDVWYKKDANPKYICYCSKVTEEQIIEAVVKGGAKTFKEVVKITGAMKNCRCEENNPLGKCCSPQIIETIKLALSQK